MCLTQGGGQRDHLLIAKKKDSSRAVGPLSLQQNRFCWNMMICLSQFVN